MQGEDRARSNRFKRCTLRGALWAVASWHVGKDNDESQISAPAQKCCAWSRLATTRYPSLSASKVVDRTVSLTLRNCATRSSYR